ncbi:MAG TPA: Zn-ribbon domain-containing OB-fold protein, partial [Acidimicrobiales bacterium]|nr:Zn-ribbon domain-containing OB-fold protein [Acidimicrobiales bacterium]
QRAGAGPAVSADAGDRRFFPDAMPVPAANAETAGWWEACLAHRLVMQRCSECGAARHPPGPVCPSCRSTSSEWAPLPGTGRVYTYTVVRQALSAVLAGTVPYVVAVIEPDGGDGTRLVSNVVDCHPEEVHIDMEVEVVWEDVSPELTLPRFRPVPR